MPDGLPLDTPAPDATLREDSAPRLQLEGYEGPLDLLLEQARTQQVDLGRLCLSGLVEQFVSAIETFRLHASLSQRGGWLVMMTRLLLLRSRLLLPVQVAEHAEAQ